MKWLIRFTKNHPVIFSIILLVFIALIFGCTYLFMHLKEHQNFETSLTYSVLALLTSAILILLAYIKTQEALEQSKTNHLLRIDERWASPEIIRAREVIHDIYLRAKHLNPHLSDNEQIKSVIALGIMKLHDNETQSGEFISLLNFLDFLETIGYLHSKKAVTTEDVSELLGNSIIYFYDIFSIYISYRRKSKDQGFYINFERLYLEVRTNNILNKEMSLSNKCTPKCTP